MSHVIVSARHLERVEGGGIAQVVLALSPVYIPFRVAERTEERTRTYLNGKRVIERLLGTAEEFYQPHGLFREWSHRNRIAVAKGEMSRDDYKRLLDQLKSIPGIGVIGSYDGIGVYGYIDMIISQMIKS